MAEVLGAVSGVVGIAAATIQSASILVKFFNNIKDAPDTIHQISSQLQSLKVVLDQIEQRFAPQDTKSAQPPENKLTKDALRECNAIVNSFTKDLKPLMEGMEDPKRTKISWARLRTAFSDQKIQSSLSRLQFSNTTLTLALMVDVIGFVVKRLSFQS